jgi:hypothetical protein
MFAAAIARPQESVSVTPFNPAPKVFAFEAPAQFEREQP